MKELILKLAKEEEGASMVEYILLLSLIAVVLIAVFTNIGTAGKAEGNKVITGLGGTTAP